MDVGRITRVKSVSLNDTIILYHSVRNLGLAYVFNLKKRQRRRKSVVIFVTLFENNTYVAVIFVLRILTTLRYTYSPFENCKNIQINTVFCILYKYRKYNKTQNHYSKGLVITIK